MKNRKKALEVVGQLEISVQQKAMLALMVLGHKPAVEVTLYKGNTDIDTFVQKMGELGIAALVAKPYIPHKGTICVSVSRSLDDAVLLKTLIGIRDTKRKLTDSFHIAYGGLMGYPLSAISAFVRGKTSPEKDEIDLLAVFKYSQENLKKEEEVVMLWRKALDEYAPKILKELDAIIK